MKVAVIGAGVSGLLATKYALQNGLEVDCFEQTANIGGNWFYSDLIGVNEHGIRKSSPVYRSLVTNFPKEIMGFEDFAFDGLDYSYVGHNEMLAFLQKYARAFDLEKCINLEHSVKSVKPLEDLKWQIEVTNLKTGEVLAGTYDGVFVCSGHHWIPAYPKNLKGFDSYRGRIMHSQDYKSPEPFEGLTILTVGSGPSGLDITFELAKVAKRVCWSHHMAKPVEGVYPQNVTQKPDLQEILENGEVQFNDGSRDRFDLILFCTGYDYVYPFLSPECEIEIDNNHVKPLFKHIININFPTMFFIGLPFITIITLLCDLQVRFSLSFLMKKVSLPSKDEMLKDLHSDIEERRSQGLQNPKMHMVGPIRWRIYFSSLAELADVKPIAKPVILDLYERVFYHREHTLKNYRKYNYRIVDDFTFEEIAPEGETNFS